MKKQVIIAMAITCSVSGCGAANSALHGYHRYTYPGTGMEPTIRPRQSFNVRSVEHGKYRPKRGDIVLFDLPSWGTGKSTVFLKRVVAIGGDKIGCCSTGGDVLLNGAPLSEPYLAPVDSGAKTDRFGPVTIPAGDLWVMGDNRPSSADSRLPGHGPIPAASVTGVAVLK